ncbi:MAG: SAM-dependent methyltransferase [Gammaproteobacteria bacterium]|nr:SAM-dependent methyltransferase [Gammaproteobacteria bacterium]
MTYIQDYYENYLEHLARAELLVCRHTLEHIQPVHEFMTTVVSAIRKPYRRPLYSEVPDTTRILEEYAFWDIYYEHCSYFTPSTLACLFHEVGLRVSKCKLVYNDQYILIEAEKGRHGKTITSPDLDQLIKKTAAFASTVESDIAEWIRLLQLYRQKGKRTVIWGSGSKAVAFLSVLGEAASAIDYLVDINPYKQGTWSPGTGHAIAGPDMIEKELPDTILVMNPVYLDEIRHEVASRGIECNYLALSNRL